jgi:hypothetical protein
MSNSRRVNVLFLFVGGESMGRSQKKNAWVGVKKKNANELVERAFGEFRIYRGSLSGADPT